MGRMAATFGGACATLVVLGACWAIARGTFLAEPPINGPAGAWFEPRATSPAVVWAVGNGADGSEASHRLASRIHQDDPDAFLYLGDVYASWPRRIAFGEGGAHDFEATYDRTYGRLAERTAPTPGNHEWRRRGDGYEPYWAAEHGEPVPSWYAFDLAGWEVVSLNSEAPHDRRSDQLAWLEELIARREGTCRLAFWHEARHSAAATGGDQPDLEPLWDTLAGHASVVVNAHDHAMQRLEPIDGITAFVSGAGGHGHHALDEDDPRLAFGDDEHYGALRLELEPGVLRHAFVSSSGRMLDSGEVRCTVVE